LEIEVFFDLLLKEIKLNDDLSQYYKFHASDRRFKFRKAYFVQRLQYIVDHMPKNKAVKVFDLGCGYGTTALFLALNGYRVEGITLEFYFKTIKKRLAYWSAFGDVSGFTYEYRNILDGIHEDTYDVIIAQDTLHHLEPITQALKKIHQALKSDGILIAVEENGSNIVQNLKLIKQRGFKKVKTIYDEVLEKDILIGDENIRSLSAWDALLFKNNMSLNHDSLNYIRFFYPIAYKDKPIEEVFRIEQRIQNKSSMLKKWFFFGLNFVAQKNVLSN